MLFAQTRFPQSVISIDSFAIPWNNPQNAMSGDNVFAEFPYEQVGFNFSENLFGDNFGFTIPSAAYIRGIEARVRCYTNFNHVLRDQNVNLYLADNGVISENRGLFELLPSSVTTLVYGHSNDDWAVPVTAPSFYPGPFLRGSDVNESGFGLSLVFAPNVGDEPTPDSGLVDFMSLTVYYWYNNVSGDNEDIFPLFVEGFEATTLSGDISLYIAGGEIVSGYIPLYTYGAAVNSGMIPLYVAGLSDSTGTIPLYTVGGAVGSGFIPLFTQGLDVSSGYIPMFISGAGYLEGNIPLYVNGAIFESGFIPLYMNGMSLESGNIPLYISGPESSSGLIPLYISGMGDGITYSGIPMYISGEPSNYISLYTYGHEPMSSGISLFINGMDLVDSNIPLHTSGVFYMTANMPLFVNAGTLRSSGNSIPLTLFGNPYSTGTDYIAQSIPLYMNSENFWAEMPLFLQGADSAIMSGSLYLHTSGALPTTYSTIPLFVCNSGTSTVIPLYVYGQHPGISFDGDIEGHYPHEASLDLFLRINPSETIPLFVCSNFEQSGIYLYTQGVYGQESGIPLYLYGVGQQNSPIPLHTFGF